jgi:hypothetical protein
MNLRPEQLQALDYARRYGTEASVASIRERAAGTFRDLEALFAAVPEELARRRPAPGVWCLWEVADHLEVSHRGVAGDLALLQSGTVPPGGPVPAGLLSPDPFARSWAGVTGDLAAVHREILATLDRSADDAPALVRAPVVVVVRCATPDGDSEPVEWVESFDWKAFALLVRVHTLEHLGQARRILDRLGRGAPETGGQEPGGGASRGTSRSP